MRIGYQVGQVVPRGSLTLQQQWRDHLEQFRAARARLAAEGGRIKLATSVLLLPLLNPVDVAEQIATNDQISEGRLVLGLGARTAVRAGAAGWYWDPIDHNDRNTSTLVLSGAETRPAQGVL